MARLRSFTLTDEAYDTLQLLATYTGCTKRRNDANCPNPSALLELIGNAQFTLIPTPTHLIPTDNSLYPEVIRQLQSEGRPPITRYSAAAIPRSQRGFYISDAAFDGLRQIAHSFNLRHHPHTATSAGAVRQRSEDTQIGNVSLLVELLGEGVYTIDGTQTGTWSNKSATLIS